MSSGAGAGKKIPGAGAASKDDGSETLNAIRYRALMVKCPKRVYVVA